MDEAQLQLFLSENASAMFALAGALVGALASFLTAWLIAGHEVKLRLKEKVLDRRIAAHEKVIEFSKALRTMVNLGAVDAVGDLIRTPAMLRSREAFRMEQASFAESFSQASTCLSIELTRKLNLL